MSKRKLFFLRDVIWFTLSAFGGPQAHIAMMLKEMVQKRRYISEKELIELHALCQLLPGPSSTQTLVAIAYKFGGLSLSIITFLIWIFPSAIFMTLAAVFFTLLHMKNSSFEFLKFIQPMAVGFIGYAAYALMPKVIRSWMGFALVSLSALATFVFRSAYVFPAVILLSGIVSSFFVPGKEPVAGSPMRFNWKKLAYLVGILLLSAVLGAIINRTSFFSLPVRLFENFYRNGMLIFGGGQVLVPLIYTEFVEMKNYLSPEEFLSGYAIQQALPGPVFSFTSFIGGMAMQDYGIPAQLIGSAVALVGINLPGLILILFIFPFWENLKKIQAIQRSLYGINAAAVGFVVAAFLLMLRPIGINYESLSMILLTFLLLKYTRVPAPVIVAIGLIFGFIF